MADEVLMARADRTLVRSGEVVRHPHLPWSAATRALLAHLAAVGFDASPRVLAVERDHDLLGYLPGASGADGWAPAVTEEGLQAAARLLRRYHEAVSGWRPDSGPVWFDGSTGAGGPGEVVCHGDFGPWNLVWRGVEPVGLLDFEYARPGDPLDDVAYACEYFVPFRDDAECRRWLRYPGPPDRRRRLGLFTEAYGLASTNGLVDRVVAGQRRMRAQVASLAASGHPRQQAAVANGDLELFDAQIRWSEGHRHLFE